MSEYSVYPSVDKTSKQFPPVVRAAISESVEVDVKITNKVNALKTELKPRIETLESKHGSTPDSPADIETAALIDNEESQTNSAVVGVVSGYIQEFGGGGGAAYPGQVLAVFGNSNIPRPTNSIEVTVLFFVPGDVPPANALSGIDVWMRTL